MQKRIQLSELFNDYLNSSSMAKIKNGVNNKTKFQL